VRVAVVSESRALASICQQLLSAEGQSVHTFSNRRQLHVQLKREGFDLYVVDAALFDAGNTAAFAELHSARAVNSAILLVLPKSQQPHLEAWVDQGADDFIFEPFSERELGGRLRALQRRMAPKLAGPAVTYGAYTFVMDSRKLYINGNIVETTDKEFDLALLLFKNGGQLVSRNRIMEAVWGKAEGSQSRTIDTHICRLRRKLALSPASGYRLVSVYSSGYRLEDLSAD
jgi:two-component system, OmpR family, response regulator RegX3